tara:strand:- start:752 stop:1036 length:285 start_codon:yes stop_codon:yes gene_type:complete
MARLNKSARGKHRWIGFKAAQELSREELIDLLSSIIDRNNWKLFDVVRREKMTLAILKTPLEKYRHTLTQLNKSPSLETLTSSGKINLVRARIL